MPPKPLRVQPKNAARRSRAEREDRERAEAERRRARAEAAAADARAEAARRRARYGFPESDSRGGRWRGRGDLRGGRGGRGGFMGQRIFTRPYQALSVAAGSSTSAIGRGRSAPSLSGRGRGASSSTRIKRDPGIKRDPDGDIAMLGIKTEPEDYGYISSDPDEKALGYAKNVDEINLISDEEDEENGSGASDRDGELKLNVRARRHLGGGLPIRLQRKEHKERIIGVNTEASSATSAALRKQAKEVSRDGKVASFDETLVSAIRKTKTRSKDIEFLGGSRKWKGVYEDDTAEPSGVTIKQEPVDDEVADLSTAAIPPEFGSATGPEDDEARDPRVVGDPMPLDPDSKAYVRAKLKHRRKMDSKPTSFQTAEEHREWTKHEEDLATVQQELGRINVNAETSSTPDDSSKEVVQMQDSDPVDRRQDAVYLFQLPTIMPDLRAPTIKQEPDSPGAERSKRTAPAANILNEARPIKVDDDDSDQDFGADPAASKAHKLALAAGYAGKLRVHRSGRTTMTWGGTSMELSMGISPYFLQSTLLTRMAPEGATATKEANSGHGGEAISFGQIRGKLKVTPAWSEILG